MRYRILFVIECADVSAVRGLQKECCVEHGCNLTPTMIRLS